MICQNCGEFTDDPAAVESIGAHFQPATSGRQINKDYEAVLRNGLDSIRASIEGHPGDPGKLYPLHERVRRVIDALQVRARQ